MAAPLEEQCLLEGCQLPRAVDEHFCEASHGREFKRTHPDICEQCYTAPKKYEHNQPNSSSPYAFVYPVCSSLCSFLFQARVPSGITRDNIKQHLYDPRVKTAWDKYLDSQRKKCLYCKELPVASKFQLFCSRECGTKMKTENENLCQQCFAEPKKDKHYHCESVACATFFEAQYPHGVTFENIDEYQKHNLALQDLQEKVKKLQQKEQEQQSEDDELDEGHSMPAARNARKPHKNSECTICLEKLATEKSPAILVLPCGHEFHSSCIQQMIQETDEDDDFRQLCPVCRALFWDGFDGSQFPPEGCTQLLYLVHYY